MVEEKNKKIEYTIYMDADKQNRILKEHGEKKVSKVERTVDFNINKRTTARDFLWHIKRIHHFWNCADLDGKRNNTPPLEIKFGK